MHAIYGTYQNSMSHVWMNGRMVYFLDIQHSIARYEGSGMLWHKACGLSIFSSSLRYALLQSFCGFSTLISTIYPIISWTLVQIMYDIIAVSIYSFSIQLSRPLFLELICNISRDDLSQAIRAPVAPSSLFVCLN